MSKFLFDGPYPKGAYVYVAFVGDKIVYVGKGTGQRAKHCTNGQSCCLLLNKCFFENIRVEVFVVREGMDNLGAGILEGFLIGFYSPEGNKHKRLWDFNKAEQELTANGLDCSVYKLLEKHMSKILKERSKKSLASCPEVRYSTYELSEERNKASLPER